MTIKNTTAPKTTEDVRNSIQEIKLGLLQGTISNQVARTLIQAEKETLASLKLEMEAAKLGCSFTAVYLNEEDRNTATKLRSVK